MVSSCCSRWLRAGLCPRFQVGRADLRQDTGGAQDSPRLLVPANSVPQQGLAFSAFICLLPEPSVASPLPSQAPHASLLSSLALWSSSATSRITGKFIRVTLHQWLVPPLAITPLGLATLDLLCRHVHPHFHSWPRGDLGSRVSFTGKHELAELFREEELLTPVNLIP